MLIRWNSGRGNVLDSEPLHYLGSIALLMQLDLCGVLGSGQDQLLRLAPIIGEIICKGSPKANGVRGEEMKSIQKGNVVHGDQAGRDIMAGSLKDTPMRKFKVTSGWFQKFVHIQMLIDEMESRFGLLNVMTRTDPGIFKAVVYITLKDSSVKKIDQAEVDYWWCMTDKSGKYYKIEDVTQYEAKVI